MQEQQILAAAIQSRQAFEAVADHVSEGDFTEQAAVVWGGLCDYYGRDGDCVSADPGILGRQIARSLSSDKHRKQFESILQELGAAGVSPENVVEDFIAVKRDAVGGKLATAILSNKDKGEVVKLIGEYEKWATAVAFDETETEVLQGYSVADLKETYDASELIRVWPTPLTERLDGGLIRGHHLVVFARPEMGKTLFVINATAGFLHQGLKVLYVGNEDPIKDIALRMVCRLNKLSKYDVLENPVETYEAALAKGYNNLVLAPLSPGTPREIEHLIEAYKPDVVVIDQLRNLKMRSEDNNYVQQLEKAATAARNIGKKYNVLVLSVTQAGDSATGKPALDMGDVDSSNTGIPAQADVMVGIGASQEDMEMGRRTLSLPKNKRSGQHGSFAVRMDETCSRMFGG